MRRIGQRPAAARNSVFRLDVGSLLELIHRRCPTFDLSVMDPQCGQRNPRTDDTLTDVGPAPIAGYLEPDAPDTPVGARSVNAVAASLCAARDQSADRRVSPLADWQCGAIRIRRSSEGTTAPTIRAVTFRFTLDTACVTMMVKTRRKIRPNRSLRSNARSTDRHGTERTHRASTHSCR